MEKHYPHTVVTRKRYFPRIGEQTDIMGFGSLPVMDYKKEIGARIRQARAREQLTLKGLAKRLNGLLKANAISMYENGQREPGVKEAVALAKALNDSAAYLLCVAEEDEMKKQELELLRNFRALPEKDRNDYARRIAAIAMIHREPVPDERLADWKAPTARPKKPVSHKK